MTEPHDVVTMGRIGVDIYPLQAGVPLQHVESFGKFLGGSATNVAVAASRLGRSTAVVTRTGDDPFGLYCHEALRGFGVDDRWVTPVRRYPTPVTFCEIFPPDDFPLYFYRQPKAPDLEIHEGELDLDGIAAARIFWMTGTGLCEEPSRGATLAALAARGTGGGSRADAGSGAGEAEAASAPGAASASASGAATVSGGTAAPGAATASGAATGSGTVAATGTVTAPRAATATVFDLDWRPAFWGAGRDGDRTAAEAAEAARPHYRAALAHATVAVGNLEECEVATGEREPGACAEALLAAGVELAVVKQGPEGVLAMHEDGGVAEVPPHPVRVVNGLGAGDAFGGALCHGLLAGWELEYVMRYANAAGALVASRLACSSAMPTAPEVEDLLRS